MMVWRSSAISFFKLQGTQRRSVKKLFSLVMRKGLVTRVKGYESNFELVRDSRGSIDWSKSKQKTLENSRPPNSGSLSKAS